MFIVFIKVKGEAGSAKKVHRMKYKNVFLSAILLVTIMGFLAPAISVFASTGTASLGVVNKPYLNQATTFKAANSSVTVKGGSSTAVAIDSTTLSPPQYLVFVLDGVTFSGSQFYLYISKDGLSQITSGDFRFAGPFNVADLSAPFKNVTGGFSIGRNASGPLNHKLVEGPIPTNLSQGNYYIKVYDGSSTSVAVSAQYIKIVPNLVLTPSAGPAGALVTANGYGFTANGVVNITFSPTVSTSFLLNASATGSFVTTFNAGYLGSKASPMIYTSTSTVSPPNYKQLKVTAIDKTSTLNASATYNEYYRDFAYINSFSPTGSLQTPTTVVPGTHPPWPNATTVNGYVLQEFDVAGDFWNPTANLTFTWDGAPITPRVSSGAPNATGYWWANFTLPVSALGNHNFRVFDANTNMSIIVNIQTTLLVTPNKGTEGSTITLTGYGYPASKPVTAFWFGTTLTTPVQADTDNILLFNGTTGILGNFTTTFTVPSNVYGGGHLIEANTSTVSATASFTVLASFSITPATAALGSPVTVVGVGLSVGTSTYSSTQFPSVNKASTGAALVTYSLTYDNFATGTTFVGNPTGSGSGVIIAAGVPMIHYVGILPTSTYLALNVTGTTTEGAAIRAQLQQVLTNQQTILSQLGSISSSLASLSTSVSNLQNSVNGVDSDVKAVGSSVSQLSSSVSQGFSSTSSSLSGIQQTLSTLATNTGLQSVSSQLSNVSTYLLVAIALAAIVLILEIVILVRRR